MSGNGNEDRMIFLDNWDRSHSRLASPAGMFLYFTLVPQALALTPDSHLQSELLRPEGTGNSKHRLNISNE